MPVPDFQSFMLPMLKLAGDGRVHTLAEARSRMTQECDLSEDERNELLPSGRQSRFSNRIAWAKAYLEKAGLIESPARGQFRISSRGLQVLGDSPRRISIGFLQQFPEFVEFQNRKNKTAENLPASNSDDSETDTPEEALEEAHAKMDSGLAAELLTEIKNRSPSFFERLVVDLLLKMGYGGSRSDAGQAVGKAGDEGIDGIISEDRLGLDMIYLQAKKWEGFVGRPEIQKWLFREFSGVGEAGSRSRPPQWK